MSQSEVYNCLKESRKPLDYQEIQEQCGLSRGSVFENLKRLRRCGLIVKEGKGYVVRDGYE